VRDGTQVLPRASKSTFKQEMQKLTVTGFTHPASPAASGPATLNSFEKSKAMLSPERAPSTPKVLLLS
jgi:hypothetical protein